MYEFFDMKISLSEIYPKGILEICLTIYVEGIRCSITYYIKNCKQPKFPSIRDRLKKLRYIHTWSITKTLIKLQKVMKNITIYMNHIYTHIYIIVWLYPYYISLYGIIQLDILLIKQKQSEEKYVDYASKYLLLLMFLKMKELIKTFFKKHGYLLGLEGI